jgi:hypothetical protein
MIKQCSNVVDEQRIQLLCNLLLVGKLKSSLKRNPDTLEMHWADLNDVTRLFALQYAVSTASCHSRDVQQLGAVDHVIIFTASNTHALGFDLETETAFVFPQRGGHTGLHSWWSNLAGVVKRLRLIALRTR